MFDPHATTTTQSGGASEETPGGDRAQLVLLGICDQLNARSSRHLLDGIDEVQFGRGDRELVRSGRTLRLRIPDPRMSGNHGRLLRVANAWVLDDPDSKNGIVVDGGLTRRAVINDGTVFELGHSFFVFRSVPVETDAPADLDEDKLRAPIPSLASFDGTLTEQFAQLPRVVPKGVSILLRGETGTGKEVVARAVHDLSKRQGPFVAVNCGGLSPGLVEAEMFGHRRGAFTGAVGDRLGYVRTADGGTLFLDEVGELPPRSQATFLRVLQEREVVPVGGDRPIKVDIYLCSATLRDLDELVDTGAFRSDLYGRLFGLTIELPALRHRKVDLGMLMRRLLPKIPGGTEIQLTTTAMRALAQYHWPLNIRELEKVLTTSVALASDGTIDIIHLPDTIRKPRVSRQTPAVGVPIVTPPTAATAIPTNPIPITPETAALKARLVELLTLHRGNVVAVSREMGTRRTQVYRWIQRFGIQPDDYRD
ncbi:MAG TPA: sigma 54-interacting transcriptional regulator [Kofleriaceae bacterium]